MTERAVVFVDGNNWYHALKRAGLTGLGWLNYAKVSSKHVTTTIMVEKAVDVMLAVDLVRMADRNEYDVAYLLASDGDYTPAAAAVKETGKKIFAASPQHGAELARVVHTFIPLKPEWFTDCF